MEYTPIQGYNISKLTFGTAAIGMKYGIANVSVAPDADSALDLLVQVDKAGINAFDTARTYGCAEQLIGQFLSGEDRKEPIHLITKFKISSKNIAKEEDARIEAYESIKASRLALGCQIIPVCLFHMDRDLPLGQVVKILPKIFESLKKDGLIHLSGVSIDHPQELSTLIEQPFVDALQVPVNLFDMRLWKNGLIDRLPEYNKIVFARSIYLQGLFFMSPDELKNNVKKAAPFIEKLHHLACKTEMSIAQLAFTFVRDISGVTSLVFGAVREEQIKLNVELLQAESLKPELREEIQSIFSDVPEEIITPGLWQL